MYSFFTLRRIFIFSICLIGIFSACTRISTTDIGGPIIPNADGVATFDTLLAVTTETFDDPDTTRIYKADSHLLGVINNDPLFGKSNASMYFELKPTTFPFSFPGSKDSLKVDSAVLILSYKGMYGDSTLPLTINVSEISQSTPLDRLLTYPSNYPNKTPINTGSSLANPTVVDIRRIASDSVNNRYENAKNQIRIRLFNSVANRFIKGYDSTNAYRSDSAFKASFAGFALTVSPGGGGNAFMKINLGDTNTKFALYYSSSSTGATKRDTSVANFNFSFFESGDANFVTRNRIGSEASKYITTTSKPDSIVYVQTSPGTYIRIRVPGLKNLNNRIIHRAELIAEQVPDDANLTTLETRMLPPRYLLLSLYDSTIKTKRNIPNDYILSQSGPNIESFGGYLSYKSLLGYDRVASYTFNLSRFVQGIVSRKDSSATMRLSAPANDSLMYTPPYPADKFSQLNYLTPSFGNDPGEGRVRLGGGTHTRFRMRMRIVYSRI